MGRIREIIDEIHLYTDKTETLIKTIIWSISWIGGIYAIVNTSDKQALSSAYLVFSLSLLMEFGKKVKEKRHLISLIVDGVFCFFASGILLMSIVSLLGAPLLKNHYEKMYDFSIGIIAFIWGDCLVTRLEPEIEPKIESMVNQRDRENDPEKKAKEMRILFEKKMKNGELGNIDMRGGK